MLIWSQRLLYGRRMLLDTTRRRGWYDYYWHPDPCWRYWRGCSTDLQQVPKVTKSSFEGYFCLNPGKVLVHTKPCIKSQQFAQKWVFFHPLHQTGRVSWGWRSRVPWMFVGAPHLKWLFQVHRDHRLYWSGKPQHQQLNTNPGQIDSNFRKNQGIDETKSGYQTPPFYKLIKSGQFDPSLSFTWLSLFFITLNE